MVDATLIAAPTSTKNQSGERDPEMHQSKKSNQWYFGMKAHIGVDADMGLVHTVRGTSGNVGDVIEANSLLHGQETDAFGDAGYQGVGKRPDANQTVRWHVAMRPGLRRALNKDTVPPARVSSMRMVERSHSWLASFDKLRACFERRIDIHTPLLSLACCVDFVRRLLPFCQLF